MAIGWQVFALTHSAFALGLVGLTAFAPQLLLVLPAGVLADRLDRRNVCITVAAVNFFCACAYFALAAVGVSHLGAWFGVLALQGISYAIGAPAQRSILPQLVTGPRFVRASALTSSAGQVITIAGPAIAGLLVATGTRWAFAAAGIADAVSALAYIALAPRPPVAAAANEPMLRTALDGIRYIFRQKIVLGAISLDLFAVLFGGATALLPIFAADILHVGSTGFGLLRAAPAVGAAIVAIFITRRPIARSGGRWLFSCVAGFGIFTIVFGFSRNYALSLVALACAGGFDMVSVVIRNTLVQLRTPDVMRGRVSAVENIFIGASNELGAFESGALAALIGASPAVVLGGVGTLVVIAAWTALFPELRRFDRLTGDEQ